MLKRRTHSVNNFPFIFSCPNIEGTCSDCGERLSRWRMKTTRVLSFVRTNVREVVAWATTRQDFNLTKFDLDIFGFHGVPSADPQLDQLDATLIRIIASGSRGDNRTPFTDACWRFAPAGIPGKPEESQASVALQWALDETIHTMDKVHIGRLS